MHTVYYTIYVTIYGLGEGGTYSRQGASVAVRGKGLYTRRDRGLTCTPMLLRKVTLHP